MTFTVPTCTCGHASGDHAGARTTFPHPNVRGGCYRCECRTFKTDSPVSTGAQLAAPNHRAVATTLPAGHPSSRSAGKSSGENA